MVFSYSKRSKSRSFGTTKPVFKYLPGQEDYILRHLDTMKKIFEEGPAASPVGAMLHKISSEEAKAEAANQMRQLERAKLSLPAKQAAFFNISTAPIRAAATAPVTSWLQSADWLGKYSILPPVVGHEGTTFSKASGGGGLGICCFIFLASDQDDKLLSYVRRYKDSHFPKTSTVAQGYKKLSLILVPLMRRSSLFKKIIRAIMTTPMSLYAKSFYEGDWLGRACFYPIARVWVWIYWLVGKMAGESQWKPYLNLGGLLK